MSTNTADPVAVSSPLPQSNASTPKHVQRTHSTQASGSHSLAPPSSHLQIQAERKDDQDLTTAVRGRQNTVAMNGLDKHSHSHSNTPSAGQVPSTNDNSNPGGHVPHAVNGLSSRVSPLDDTEAVDQFDTYKDFSPSPRSQVSSNNHASSSQQQHYALSTSQSFYASSTQSIPDIISNIDRSLLSIIAPFNFLDPQTLAARMAAIEITKASYLYKRQSHPMLGGMRYRYNKRYVLLKDNQLRYDSSKKDNPLKGGMDLRYVTVERGDDTDVFWLEVSEWWKHNGKFEKTKMERRVIEWRCENELQREEWVQAIQDSKMMHEVYPLNKGEGITPFPVALVLGLPQAGRSTVFKHLMAWRPASVNPAEQQADLPKSNSFSSFSPRIGEQTTHTKPSHHHRYTDLPQESEGFMPVETRLSWKKRIFLHTLSGLCTLGEAIDEHTVDSSFVYAKTVLEDERTKITANDDENITLDRHCIEYMHRVWNEPQVQQLYQSQYKCTQPTVVTLKHFIEQIDKMSSSDWIPSFTDVIYCYNPSQIITWKQVDPHTTHRFRIYDIGAAYPMDRVEKWKLERFSKASFVVFVVNVCGYDRPSTVDPHISMLQESLLLYQQLVQNELLQQWGPILVYFTHADLLPEQLLLTPFKDKVHGYEGSGDKNNVLRCMMGMFAKVGGARYQGRVVCAIDRAEMKKVIAEDIERRREFLRKQKERAAQR